MSDASPLPNVSPPNVLLPHVSLPNFRLPDDVSPTTAAAALIDAYERLSPLPDKAARAVSAVQRTARDPRSVALAAAAAAVAATIDADPPRFDRHPYHNRQHFCEVVLAVSVLADVHRLADDDAQLLVLAAIAHDVVHDGRTGSEFRLERASAAFVAPALVDAKVDAADAGRLEAMLLATEPNEGVACALAARRFHAEGGARPPVPDAAPELAALFIDARLAQLATLLCEADVLPSVGLTFEYGLRVQHRLAEEWGRRLEAGHKLAFIDEVLGHCLIGPFFAANVASVRGELARMADASHPR